MLSLCKFVKSVCVSAVISPSFAVAVGVCDTSHSSHSVVVWVDLSLYFIVLLFKLLLLLLLLRLVLFSVDRGKQWTFSGVHPWQGYTTLTGILRGLRLYDRHVSLDLLLLVARGHSHHHGGHHRRGACRGRLAQSLATVLCHHTLSNISLGSHEDDVKL